MFTQFRVFYPKGSLVTELSAIDHGKYIVRCLVQVEGTTLVTALAAAETVELAEDQARSRALAVLGIDTTTANGEKDTPVPTSKVLVPLTPTPTASTGFSSQSMEPTQQTRFPEAVRASDTSSLSFSELRGEEATNPVVTTAPIAEEIPFTEEFSAAEVETFQEIEAPVSLGEKMQETPMKEAPVMSYSQGELETDTSGISSTSNPIDFSDVIARTNVELKRLGWTNQQGRDYLVQTYGKRSRQLLTDAELLDFLNHLESQPTPE
jgi:hypothetical protein